MKLWIRSQDKENLLMVNKMFCHCTCPEMESIGEYYIGNKEWVGDKDYILLGKYKTKERAIEVLDEIQKMIEPTLITTEFNSEIKQGIDKLSFDVIMQPVEDKITYIQPNIVIYEMPQE